MTAARASLVRLIIRLFEAVNNGKAYSLLSARDAARDASSAHAYTTDLASERFSTLASTGAATQSSAPTKEPKTSMLSLSRTTSGGSAEE